MSHAFYDEYARISNENGFLPSKEDWAEWERITMEVINGRSHCWAPDDIPNTVHRSFFAHLFLAFRGLGSLKLDALLPKVLGILKGRK